jgi:Arm DNA-binding domain
MALTDTRIRTAKPKPKPYKFSDGGGMYLLVMPDGARYWRMDYRFAGKRRTLALGVYPTLSLSEARTRREDARGSLAQDIDPGVVKKARKRAAKVAGESTFEAVAREWITNQRLARLEADIFPHIGPRPIAEISAPETLDALRKIEKRGAIETALRLRQLCGQVSTPE